MNRFCEKCGSKLPPRVEWHKSLYDKGKYYMVDRDCGIDEHLHYFCPNCGYNWTGPTKDYIRCENCAFWKNGFHCFVDHPLSVSSTITSPNYKCEKFELKKEAATETIEEGDIFIHDRTGKKFIIAPTVTLSRAAKDDGFYVIQELKKPLTLSPQDWKRVEISLRGAQVPAGTNEVLARLSDGSLEVRPAKEK